MSAVLQIAIGLVLIYMLMGLITSSVLEVAATVMHARGKLLRQSLRKMLSCGDGGDALFRQIYLHPLIGGSPVLKNPSYVTSTHFTMALLDVLGEGQAVRDIQVLEKKVAALPDGAVRRTLQAFLNHADGNVSCFIEDAGIWYDDVMRRTGEIYKTHCHIVTFLFGLVLAVALNVDTVRITQTLMMNESLRTQITDSAVAISHMDLKNSDINTQIAKASAKLLALGQPVGWQDNGPVIMTGKLRQSCNIPDTGGQKPLETRVRNYFCVRGGTGAGLTVLGWLLTAIASAFGAPFWYNILSRLLPLHGGSHKKTSGDKSGA